MVWSAAVVLRVQQRVPQHGLREQDTLLLSGGLWEDAVLIKKKGGINVLIECRGNVGDLVLIKYGDCVRMQF